MKKIIILILSLFLLTACSVEAAVPPQPMPVRFIFIHDGTPVENFKVKLTIGSETIERYTNPIGGIEVDVGEGSGDFKNANPYTDTLTLNCGFSVCNKNYDIRTLDTPYKETFALTERPETSCPPCGGGGGGCSCTYTESKCRDLYPCEECEAQSCPICPSTDCPDCVDIVCPTCDDCKDIHDKCPDEIRKECLTGDYCPDCPSDSWASEIIAGILGLAGGLGIYFKIFNKKIFTGGNTGIKTYRGKDGELKLLHKHPGTKGYHDPNISHRTPETHPKGMIDCSKHYFKNKKGEWEYK